MDITTGREFSFTNPQDDAHLYPAPPAGFQYDLQGRLIARPNPTTTAIRPEQLARLNAFPTLPTFPGSTTNNNRPTDSNTNRPTVSQSRQDK